MKYSFDSLSQYTLIPAHLTRSNHGRWHSYIHIRRRLTFRVHPTRGQASWKPRATKSYAAPLDLTKQRKLVPHFYYTSFTPRREALAFLFYLVVLFVEPRALPRPQAASASFRLVIFEFFRKYIPTIQHTHTHTCLSFRPSALNCYELSCVCEPVGGPDLVSSLLFGVEVYVSQSYLTLRKTNVLVEVTVTFV